MTKVVIVGAGLSGLYLVNRLLQGGIQPLVYDPRAGQYTRPGQLSYSSYEAALKGIDFNLFLSNPELRSDEISKSKELQAKLIRAIHRLMTQEGGYEPGNVMQEDAYDLSQKETDEFPEMHIKDVERALYHTAIGHGLRHIERKSFTGFATDQPVKGIYVEGNEGPEFVACDYVFDCSGKRAVIHAVNKVIPEAPFKLSLIAENVRVKNHFLAYIKIPNKDYKAISRFGDEVYLRGNMAEFNSKKKYRRGIQLLKPFGWREFAYPRCYGHPFGTKKKINKVCMYLEAPDNLPEDQQLPWMEAVFNAILGKSVEYELVAPSKKYEKKPRLSQFTMEPLSLTPYCYEGSNLPEVIAIGDSQTDSQSFLALGLSKSCQGIDLLLKFLQVRDGEIISIDTEAYDEEAFSQSASYRRAIKKHYKERSAFFDTAFFRAIDVFDRTQVMIDYLNADIEDNTTSQADQKSARQLPELSIFQHTPAMASLNEEDGDPVPTKVQRT